MSCWIHAWAPPAEQHLSTSCLETELREMLILHRQSSSTPAHLSIPSMQEEISLLAVSLLLVSSVRLRIPEESLHVNRKPTWEPAEGKGNQHYREFCLISPHQSIIQMSQLELAHSKGFTEARERQVAKFRAPAQFTVIHTSSSRVSDAGSFPTPDPFVRF